MKMLKGSEREVYNNGIYFVIYVTFVTCCATSYIVVIFKQNMAQPNMQCICISSNV